MTGQIPIHNLTPAQITEAHSRLGDKVTIQSGASTVWSKMEMNLLVPPFNDIRVRKAIAYAVDKDGTAIATGSEFPNGGFLQPGVGWDLPKAELLKYVGYDPDQAANVRKAKDLLAQAGYANGFDMKIFTHPKGGYQKPAISVQSMLKGYRHSKHAASR